MVNYFGQLLDKMEVLLVNPPFHRFFGSEQDYIPLGLSYLAATYKDCFVYNTEIDNKLSYVGYDKRLEGQETYINSVDVDGKIWKEIEERIRGYDPKIVGIYAPSVKLKSAMHVAKIVKKITPNIKIIIGGPHPTIRPNDVIDNKNVDCVIMGEGEKIFPTIIKDLLNGDNKQIYHEKEFIKNIDEIPFPARHKMLDIYSPAGYGHIISARGCPFMCAYCGTKAIWKRTIRFRSIDNIVAEIKQVRDTYGTKDFTFWDETFTIDKKRVLEFCEKVKPLGISWRCDTRIDVIDKPLILKMMDAGLEHISIGIESGNQETLDFIKKGITLEQTKETAKMLNETGIFWKAYMMIGFPNETEEQILDTMNIIDELQPKRATLSIFTPYPGTELFDYCVEHNIIEKDVDWEKFSHQSKYNYFTPKIPKRRFEELVKIVSKRMDDYNNETGGYKKWVK